MGKYKSSQGTGDMENMEIMKVVAVMDDHFSLDVLLVVFHIHSDISGISVKHTGGSAYVQTIVLNKLVCASR